MSHVWVTSDLHIRHKKVAHIRAAEFGVIFDAAYRSLDETDRMVMVWHDNMLARQWDSVVGEHDVVWLLGDISSGTNDGQREALRWLKKRKGRKRLVPGNHDGVHGMQRDGHKWEPEYREVFERITMAGKIRIPLPEGHTSVLLSHFPYKGDHTKVDRHQEWRLPDKGAILLHGHTHSKEKLSFGRDRWVGIPGVNPERGTPQIHVGVDAWGGRPVSLDEIRGMVWELEGVS